MLEDLDDPIPSTEQLERFGLFDLRESNRLLAEYRSMHPSPGSLSEFSSTPSSPNIEVRPPGEPQQRHSFAALPPQAQLLASTPSPTSPSSPRLNPFAFVRNKTLRPSRPRPSQQRARSTGDVREVPPPPTPALGETQSFFADAPGNSDRAADARPSTALSRHETIKQNKAPRKLRKAVQPKITIRTDDDYLLRPNAGHSLLPSRSSIDEPAASRPASLRQPSWQSTVSSPLATSPTSYDSSVSPRPSPPVSAFPAGIRREVLPPVESAKKRGSATSSGDDYLADNERTRASPRASRGRFSIGGPGSPTSAAGVWGKLKLGKRSGSRPPSVASIETRSTWEVDDEGATSEQTFEVLGRPSRPGVERSMSETLIDTTPVKSTSADQVDLPLSASSPNLSRIVEQPEALSKRSSTVSTSSRLRTSSIDSLPLASGATTPAAISAASSMTIREAFDPSSGMPRSRPNSNLHLASSASYSSLRSHPPSPLSPLITSQPRRPSPPLGRSASTASLSSSWRSSPSSQSRDSLLYSGDDTLASSAEMDDTGASSAPDDEAEEAGLGAKALPLDRLVIDIDGRPLGEDAVLGRV
ncbi:hypothetical protein JCM10213v2_006612 [Rhodosporidiobolus nylandii]